MKQSEELWLRITGTTSGREPGGSFLAQISNALDGCWKSPRLKPALGVQALAPSGDDA